MTIQGTGKKEPYPACSSSTATVSTRKIRQRMSASSARNGIFIDQQQDSRFAMSLLAELESEGSLSYKYCAPNGAGNISSLPIQDQFPIQTHNSSDRPPRDQRQLHSRSRFYRGSSEESREVEPGGTQRQTLALCLPGLPFFCLMVMLLFGLLCFTGARVRADDSRWLVTPDVNAIEDYRVLPASTALVKALTDAAEYVQRWSLPRDANTWRERRPQVERALLKAIGLEKLPERTPLNPRIIASHDLGDYVLDNLIFYSRPDLPVTANLYRPKGSNGARHPAVVCPLGHYLDGGKANLEYQILAIKLAKLGFFVLIYDAIGHGERLISGNTHHEAGFALLPLGQTIAGWMVWESMRAIDFLSTLPEVDSSRIGVTGNSGGGLNTLFTAALDQRVRAAAIAGYVFHFNHWIKYAGSHCTCCYLPGLYRSMEWFEVASLTAPRALMMLQGERDDIFAIVGARKAGRETETVYSLLGHKGAVRFDEISGQHHAYSQPFRERMYGWMLLHLMGQGDGKPTPEGSIQPLPENDERLLCDKSKTLMTAVPSVVELARRQAQRAISDLSSADLRTVRENRSGASSQYRV